MSVFYIDTSAIAKRYLAEIGTGWIRNITDPASGNVIVVCDLTPVEFVSTLARLEREGQLNRTDVNNRELLYLAHHEHEYLSLTLDTDIFLRARTLLKNHRLRTLDALHLSSALEATRIFGVSLTFVASDKHLPTAAAIEGLNTDNPLNHP